MPPLPLAPRCCAAVVAGTDPLALAPLVLAGLAEPSRWGLAPRVVGLL